MKIQGIERTCVIAVFSLELQLLNRDIHFIYNHRLEALNRFPAFQEAFQKRPLCIYRTRYGRSQILLNKIT